MATDDFADAVRQRRETLDIGSGQQIERPTDFAAGVRARRQRAADLRASSVVQQGIDPGELGPSGFPDFGARFDIGLSDTFDEKRMKFMERFPDGDFIMVSPPSGGREILYRKNGNEPFAKFDAPMLEKFEPMGDIADIAGDLPSAVAEAFLVRGGRLVKQLSRVFLGEVAGRTGKEVVEELRGYQKETIKQMAGRIAQESLVGTAGAALTMAISGPLNFLRGSSNIQVVPGSRPAQMAAETLGLPPILPSQVSQSPLIQKLGQQAAATTGTIKAYVQNQQRQMVNTLRGLRDADRASLLRGDLQKLHEDARRQVIEGARLSDKTLRDGGKAVQQGIQEYDDLASTVVRKSYDDARKIETPEFDHSPALAVANEIEQRAAALGENLSPEVTDAVKRLKSFDPDEPPIELESGAIIDATERLRSIRSALWEAKTPNPGEIVRAEHEVAGKIYAAVTHVLQNPKNSAPGFAEAWAKANALAARRFKTMEQLLVIRAQRDETPTMLASRLAQPLQQDNILVLKEVLPEARFNEFRDAVKADFIDARNVDGLTKRLDSFDKPTLDTLLSPAEQANLRNVGRQIDRLNRIGIKELAERQVRTAAVMDDLINGNSTAAISRLREAASPAQRQTIRAALMERVSRNATVIDEGVPVVDAKALRAEIGKLRDTGAIRFLGLSDVQTLRNLDRYAEFVAVKPDAGGAMQTASTAAGALQLRMSAITTYLHNLTLGRLLVSKPFQRMVTGSGKKPLPYNSLRVMGAILADAANDAEQQ